MPQSRDTHHSLHVFPFSNVIDSSALSQVHYQSASHPAVVDTSYFVVRYDRRLTPLVFPTCPWLHNPTCPQIICRKSVAAASAEERAHTPFEWRVSV